MQGQRTFQISYEVRIERVIEIQASNSDIIELLDLDQKSSPDLSIRQKEILEKYKDSYEKETLIDGPSKIKVVEEFDDPEDINFIK